MHAESGGRKKGEFRRVSKARIFDGYPLKVSVYAVTVMVMVYAGITAVISLLFSYFQDVGISLVLWTLLPGGLLGYFILVLERWLRQLKQYMFPGMGKLLTAFLLFFAHTIGYLTLSSIVFSYPLGRVMETFRATPGIAADYSLFSVNFFIVLAILSWFRNVRTAPCRCI